MSIHKAAVFLRPKRPLQGILLGLLWFLFVPVSALWMGWLLALALAPETPAWVAVLYVGLDIVVVLALAVIAWRMTAGGGVIVDGEGIRNIQIHRTVKVPWSTLQGVEVGTARAVVMGWTTTRGDPRQVLDLTRTDGRKTRMYVHWAEGIPSLVALLKEVVASPGDRDALVGRYLQQHGSKSRKGSRAPWLFAGSAVLVTLPVAAGFGDYATPKDVDKTVARARDFIDSSPIDAYRRADRVLGYANLKPALRCEAARVHSQALLRLLRHEEAVESCREHLRDCTTDGWPGSCRPIETLSAAWKALGAGQAAEALDTVRKTEMPLAWRVRLELDALEALGKNDERKEVAGQCLTEVDNGDEVHCRLALE